MVVGCVFVFEDEWVGDVVDVVKYDKGGWVKGVFLLVVDVVGLVG